MYKPNTFPVKKRCINEAELKINIPQPTKNWYIVECNRFSVTRAKNKRKTATTAFIFDKSLFVYYFYSSMCDAICIGEMFFFSQMLHYSTTLSIVWWAKRENGTQNDCLCTIFAKAQIEFVWEIKTTFIRSWIYLHLCLQFLSAVKWHINHWNWRYKQIKIGWSLRAPLAAH